MGTHINEPGADDTREAAYFADKGEAAQSLSTTGWDLSTTLHTTSAHTDVDSKSG